MSSAFSVITTAIVGKGHSVSADLVALHIYSISFLLLKYLCMETEGAAKRSEELGFADLTQIPELPMLEILHGLQVKSASAPVLSTSSLLSLKGCKLFEIMKKFHHWQSMKFHHL